MSSSYPIVYACFSTDVIHEGHMNIIRTAKKYGHVIIGVMSDEAMVSYYHFPTISFEERIAMIKDIPDVDEVVVQETVSYVAMLEKIRPDYVIHGDQWHNGPWGKLREELILGLSAYGGKLIEVTYTLNDEVLKCEKKIREKLMMPEYRRKRLRQLLGIRPIVKALEVHSGLTGLIVEKTIIERGGKFDQFDAMWISSLCDSTEKGKPDIEVVDMTSRFRTINDIMEVTTKPIIFDGDTGGLTEHFAPSRATYHALSITRLTF